MAQFSKFNMLLALNLNVNGGSILNRNINIYYFKKLENIRIKLEKSSSLAILLNILIDLECCYNQKVVWQDGWMGGMVLKQF